MKPLSASRTATPAVAYLGLVWVYSGAVWLLALMHAARQGLVPETVALALRLGATLGLGVGLCALESWAWAPALSLSVLYAAGGVALVLTTGYTLATLPPGVLSWEPVFFGFPMAKAAQFGVLGGVLAAVAAGSAFLLWRNRGHYEIPHRRAFGVLVRKGVAVAVAIAAVDLFLLAAFVLGGVP